MKEFSFGDCEGEHDPIGYFVDSDMRVYRVPYASQKVFHFGEHIGYWVVNSRLGLVLLAEVHETIEDAKKSLFEMKLKNQQPMSRNIAATDDGDWTGLFADWDLD